MRLFRALAIVEDMLLSPPPRVYAAIFPLLPLALPAALPARHDVLKHYHFSTKRVGKTPNLTLYHTNLTGMEHLPPLLLPRLPLPLLLFTKLHYLGILWGGWGRTPQDYHYPAFIGLVVSIATGPAKLGAEHPY